MMNSGLLVVLMVSPVMALPQKPAFTVADVHAIEALVVEEIVPADGKLDSRLTKGRLLLIDSSQASAVMRKLVDGGSYPGLTIARAFRATSQSAAIQCGGPGRVGCQVVDDGLYLSISDAAFVPATGELRVHAGVVWADAIAGEYYIYGYDIDLFYARTDSGWRLTRKGTARVG